MTGGLVNSFRGLRAIVRMEIRELFRHRGRSALILALVAIPVAAIVGGTSLVKITTPTDEERRLRAMGLASLRVEAPFAFEDRQKILDALPAGATVQSWRETGEVVRVAGRSLRAKAFVLGDSPWPERPAGLAEGTHRLIEGRLPRNSGEVALSSVLLRGLERSIGDLVRLEYGGERTVVGVVSEPEQLDSPLVLRTAAAVEHSGAGYLLVGLGSADPVGSSDSAAGVATRLRELDAVVDERNLITGEGGQLAWGLFVLGTIGFLEAGLVVASTFIVGLRRRQYEIGLLGSTGATGKRITLSLLASTGALAVPGVCLGALLGAGTAGLFVPFLDDWNNRLNGSFELAWGTVIAALLLGVVAALAATAIPAWAAGRMPIREALGGRRPIKTRSSVWLGLGLGMVGLGVLMVLLAPRDMALLGALAAIVGSILGVLGFGVCSPFVLDFLGRRAGKLPLRWRLAVRDAGRFRARNGPVVTAVLAGMSMSVTVAFFVASLDKAFDALPAAFRTDQLLVAGPGAEPVAARIASELSAMGSVPLMAAYVHGEPVRVQRTNDALPNPSRQWVAVGDAETLRTIGAEAGIEALERGQLIQVTPASGGLLEMMGIKTESTESKTTFTTWRDEAELDPLPIVQTTVDQNVMSPAYVLHRSKLEQLGWQEGPPIDRSMSPWLVRLDSAVTQEQLGLAEQFASEAVGVTVDAQLRRQNPTRSFYHAVQWLCIFTGLVIVLVATALSSVESAADSRVLRTVGAAPGLIRGHQAARAAYLAFLGCLLAVPAGMTPAIVVFEAANLPLDLVVPWFDLVVTMFALPALAYLVTWLAYREPRSVKARLNPAVRAAALAGLSIGLAIAGTPASAENESIRWEPYEGEALDGSPLHGELGRLDVPLQHADPNGPTMELAFVRYRTSHENPGPPIFYLAGGPGGSGVDLAGGIGTHPQMRLLEYADVIGIDQRGTGLSRPQLESPEELRIQLPLDRAVTRDETIAGLSQAAARTVRHWARRGVDPKVYNTRESADDIDAVRQAFGFERDRSLRGELRISPRTLVPSEASGGRGSSLAGEGGRPGPHLENAEYRPGASRIASPALSREPSGSPRRFLT